MPELVDILIMKTIIQLKLRKRNRLVLIRFTLASLLFFFSLPQVTVMKGSSRNKDRPAEGEGTGKRPKRKCLQWHPLLAKKLLDFSEEEEEEDEEEDIDKVISPFIVEV